MARPGLQKAKRIEKLKRLARFYNICSILGNHWAKFFTIIGPRDTGKSYAVTEYMIKRKEKLGDQCKAYWLRISETSTKALLANKAKRLVDGDLVTKYTLDLSTKGSDVYNHGKEFCTVLPLSGFGKAKGVAFFDKNFTGEYIIVLDEFQLEQGEKATSFDILYNLIGVLENLVRDHKGNIRIFFLANNCSEASSVLKAFNFVPTEFGRFYLRSKKCVIDNLMPTEQYLKDRKGSIADLLGGSDDANFTNETKKNIALISKERTKKLTAIIKFTKNPSTWYSIFDDKIIRRWKKGESVSQSKIICMRRYIGFFSQDLVNSVIERFDSEYFSFKSFIDLTYFQNDMQKIKLK